MALLSVKSLTKLFGGLTALDKFDLQVTAGEIVGIIGPNGSGKTTFFNVLTGMYAANGGEIYLEGAKDNLLTRKTHEIIACGPSVMLRINGQEVNRTTRHSLQAGRICITAEGDEIHFRGVQIQSR